MSGVLVSIGILLLVALTVGVATMFTYLVWRAGFNSGWRGARSNSPQCPRCGYHMGGQRHCRCPECGTEGTLEQLWRTPVFRGISGVFERDDEQDSGSPPAGIGSGQEP